MGIKISKQRHKPRITKAQIPWLVRGAIRSNNIETMQYLLTYPNDVNPSMVIDGVCPLNLAIELGRIQMVKILIKAGADIHVAESPRYPLHQAAIFGHAEIIEFLIKSGCCLSTFTERRESCLHLIASQRSEKYINAAHVLIQYQIDPNILNDDGLSALHFASAQMIPIFCSFDRTNLNILSEAGDSPLLSAIKDRKEAEVLELLKFSKFALEEKLLDKTLHSSEITISENYESDNYNQTISRQNTKNYETSFYNKLKSDNHKRTSSSKSTNSTVTSKNRLNLSELMSRGLATVRANSTTSIQLNNVNNSFSNRQSHTPNENCICLVNQSQNHEDKPITAFINSLNTRLINWHNSNTLRKSSEFISNKLFLSKSNHQKSCVPHYYSGLRINSSNQKLNMQQMLMYENACPKHQMNNSFCSSLNTNCHQTIRRQESWNKNITPHHPSLLTSTKALKNRQNSLCGMSLLDVSGTNPGVPPTNQVLSTSSSTKKSSNRNYSKRKSHYRYINIDIQDKIGMTPLILAAEAGTSGLNIFTALLNVGADLTMKDKMNMSALHYAAYVGALATVRVFFDYTHTRYPQMTANIRKKSHELLNIQDKYGRTPIYLATARGHKEVVSYLISIGADLHIANYEKKSPLYISAYFGHLEIVNTLLRNGAKVDQADSHMKTPLYVATYHGRNDIVDLLLAAGANVNATDKNGKTPLYIGVLHGNLALANKLLRAGAIINKPDHEGLGPLHMAVKFPKLDIPMIKLLLSHGCDPVNLAAFTRWLITHGIIPEECIEKDEELRTWLHLEESSVKSLKRICRVEIQRALGHIDSMKSKIAKLPLPESLQAYVSMKAL